MEFPPVYGTLNENQLLRAQQNQKRDTNIYRLLPRYTSISFWQKHNVLVQNFQKKVYHGFLASLRYVERKSALEVTTKQRGGYLYSLLSRHSFFLVKNTILTFILTWFVTTYVFCSSSKKSGATHTYTTYKQSDPLTRYIVRTTYVRIIARNSLQTKQRTRNTTQATNTEHT